MGDIGIAEAGVRPAEIVKSQPVERVARAVKAGNTLLTVAQERASFVSRQTHLDRYVDPTKFDQSDVALVSRQIEQKPYTPEEASQAEQAALRMVLSSADQIRAYRSPTNSVAEDSAELGKLEDALAQGGKFAQQLQQEQPGLFLEVAKEAYTKAHNGQQPTSDAEALTFAENQVNASYARLRDGRSILFHEQSPELRVKFTTGESIPPPRDPNQADFQDQQATTALSGSDLQSEDGKVPPEEALQQMAAATPTTAKENGTDKGQTSTADTAHPQPQGPASGSENGTAVTSDADSQDTARHVTTRTSAGTQTANTGVTRDTSTEQAATPTAETPLEILERQYQEALARNPDAPVHMDAAEGVNEQAQKLVIAQRERDLTALAKQAILTSNEQALQELVASHPDMAQAEAKAREGIARDMQQEGYKDLKAHLAQVAPDAQQAEVQKWVLNEIAAGRKDYLKDIAAVDTDVADILQQATPATQAAAQTLPPAQVVPGVAPTTPAQATVQAAPSPATSASPDASTAPDANKDATLPKEVTENDTYKNLQIFKAQRANQVAANLAGVPSELLEAQKTLAQAEAVEIFVALYATDKAKDFELLAQVPEIKRALDRRDQVINGAIEHAGVKESDKAQFRQQIDRTLQKAAMEDRDDKKLENHRVQRLMRAFENAPQWDDKTRRRYGDLMNNAQSDPRMRNDPSALERAQLEYLSMTPEQIAEYWNKIEHGGINIFEILFSLGFSIGKGILTQSTSQFRGNQQ